LVLCAGSARVLTAERRSALARQDRSRGLDSKRSGHRPFPRKRREVTARGSRLELFYPKLASTFNHAVVVLEHVKRGDRGVCGMWLYCNIRIIDTIHFSLRRNVIERLVDPTGVEPEAGLKHEYGKILEASP